MAIAASGADTGTMAPVASPAAGSTAASVGSRAAARHRSLPVNIAALVLVVGGAVVQLIAFADSAWIDSPSGRLTFRGLSEWTEPGYAQAFVSWIAWVLVAVSLAFGVAACIRWRGAGVFRYTGALLSVAGAVMTVAAVLVLAYQAKDHSFQVARNYGVGAYLAVLGLLATALGTAAGTGRRG
jgi:hypothetical protein